MALHNEYTAGSNPTNPGKLFGKHVSGDSCFLTDAGYEVGDIIQFGEGEKAECHKIIGISSGGANPWLYYLDFPLDFNHPSSSEVWKVELPYTHNLKPEPPKPSPQTFLNGWKRPENLVISDLPNLQMSSQTTFEYKKLDDNAEAITNWLKEKVCQVFGLPAIAVKDMPKNTILLVSRDAEGEFWAAKLEGFEFSKPGKG